jgi:hypothetical protein
LASLPIDRIEQKHERQRKSVDLTKFQKELQKEQTAMKERKSKSHEIRKSFDESITSNIKKKMMER